MTFAGMLNQPLTVHLRGVTGTDQYNNEVVGTTSSYPVEGYLEQTAATEVIVDRQTYTSDWLLVLPAGSALTAWSQVAHGSDTFEVIGPPSRPWNPRTRSEHHVEARLKATSG